MIMIRQIASELETKALVEKNAGLTLITRCRGVEEISELNVRELRIQANLNCRGKMWNLTFTIPLMTNSAY